MMDSKKTGIDDLQLRHRQLTVESLFSIKPGSGVADSEKQSLVASLLAGTSLTEVIHRVATFRESTTSLFMEGHGKSVAGQLTSRAQEIYLTMLSVIEFEGSAAEP